MTSTDPTATPNSGGPSPDPGDIDRALDRISADAAGDDAEPVEAGPRRPVLLALGAIGAVVFLWMLFRPIPHEDTSTAPTAPPSADAVDRMATDADPGWMRNADTARFLPGGSPMVPPVYGEGTGAQPRAAGDRSAAAPPDSAGASTGAAAATAGETADPRREAFRVALKSKPLGSASPLGLTLSESDAAASLTPAPSYADMAAAAETEAAARAPGATQRDTGEVPGARGAVGSSYVSGGTGDPRRLAAPARLAPRTVTGPDRAATLTIGTVIEGQLAVSINSDLPGGAIGVVTHPVYDVSLRHEVIPAGSWLYGTYESAIVAGQGRLVLQWTAIRFPDGRTYELPALRAGDGTGASGIPGRVNNHYGRVFGQALLSSVIAAGFTSGSAPAGSQPSRRDALADAAASQLGETAAQVTRRNLSIKPTITVPRLTPFTIMLDRELTFLPASR